MIRNMIFAIAAGAAIGTAAVIPILDHEAEALPPRCELQRESFPQLGSQTRTTGAGQWPGAEADHRGVRHTRQAGSDH
jgi:hypothetical protein